jgi:MFS family permease
VLGVLVLAYTFNFIDRTIIYTIGQAVKEDLELSDTQLGLLGGLAFAVFYTVLGIPIARLADRYHRVNVIAVSVAVWSLFTAACGLAVSYVQLLLLRMGVGIGEAGLSPPAHSLVSDYYPPERRGAALSTYALGIPLGVMFGAVAGGWLTDNFSWRAAFIVVGLPGLLVALIIKLFVREPPRGWSEPVEATPVSQPPPPLAIVVRHLWRHPGIAHLVAGCTLVSMAAYGTSTYAQAYFIREFGVSYTAVGFVFGLVGGSSCAIGTLLGGFLADRFGGRKPYWYALVPGLGVLIALPLYVLVYTSTNWTLAASLLFLPGIFHFMYSGPTFALIQNSVPGRTRATSAALLLLAVNLIGLGIGPPLTGWLIDTFSELQFHAVSIADFFDSCPGGLGAANGGVELDRLCRTSVAQGTQYGILAALAFYLWGAVHYLASAAAIARRPGNGR